MIQNDSIFEKMNDMKQQGTPFVLATVVRCESPTSAKPGAKAIIHADGQIEGWIGGGCAQPAVLSTAKEALQDGQSRLIRVRPTKDGAVETGIIDFGMTCHSGGTLDIFIEPVMARPALLIIGASPSAQALAGLASRTGFEVTAAFPGIHAEIFPDADHLIDGLDFSNLKTPSFVVVATQGKRDEAGLEAALSTQSPYIAFIASDRKASKLREYLKAQGHAPARVNAIISPAGIEIGAVTPEEIALSVLAGLVKQRRETPATPENIAPSPPEKPEAQDGTAIDPICHMEVDIATAEFQTPYQGRDYYFCCGGCQHRFEQDPENALAKTK